RIRPQEARWLYRRRARPRLATAHVRRPDRRGDRRAGAGYPVSRQLAGDDGPRRWPDRHGVSDLRAWRAVYRREEGQADRSRRRQTLEPIPGPSDTGGGGPGEAHGRDVVRPAGAG